MHLKKKIKINLSESSRDCQRKWSGNGSLACDWSMDGKCRSQKVQLLLITILLRCRFVIKTLFISELISLKARYHCVALADLQLTM